MRLASTILFIATVCITTPMYALTVHPSVSEDVSAPYAVTVNGTTVPVDQVGHGNPVYYARFIADEAVTVTVEDTGGGSLTGELRPAAIEPKTARVFAYVHERPGARILSLRDGEGNDLPPLFVIYERPETNVPDPNTPGVVNVLEHGVALNEEPQTAAIQKLLDEAEADPARHTVYFPAGKYHTGTLYIRGDVQVYLEPGAILWALPDPSAFPVDEGRSEQGISGSTHSNSRVLMFDGANGASLRGRGTIDGLGTVLRNQHDRRVQVIDMTDSRNITVEGVVLRNSASWTFHILHCTNVHVDGVKVIADWSVSNSDGINPDASRNVLIENIFCYTGDDSLVAKATGNSDLLQDVANITFRDSVVCTRKTALKVGTETRAHIDNVLFENIDVVNSSRGIGLWMRDGHRMSNITYRDIRMNLVEVPGESRSGQPILMTLEDRAGVGTIDGVRIENVTIEAPWYAQLNSLEASPIRNVVLKDITWKVLPRTMKKDEKPLFELHHVDDLVMDGLAIDWSEAEEGQWSGIFSAADAVEIRGLKETGMAE